MVSGPLAPGVFIKERSSGVRTIVGVGTSTPAFLGYTVRGPQTPTPPVRINSWSEFVDTFHFRSPMGAEELGRELDRLSGAVAEGTAELERLEADLEEKATTGDTPVLTQEEITVLARVQAADWAGDAVSGEERQAAEAAAEKVTEAEELAGPYGLWIAAGNELASLKRREGELTVLAGYFEQSGKIQLPEAVYGFFANGGTSCYVLRLDPDKPLAGEVDGNADQRTGLAGLKTVPDVTMVAVPDVWREDMTPETAAAIMGKVVGHCVTMRNRLALLEPPPGTAPAGVPQFLEKLAGPDGDDAAFTALYYPWVNVPGVDGIPRGCAARSYARRGFLCDL